MANKPNNNRTDRGKNRKAGNAPGLAPEQKREQLAKQYGLKHKTKAVIDELLKDPKLSNTDAYLMHHKTTNRNTAATAMNKLLKKPSVIGYSQAAVGKAKRRIVELVESSNESIALKASQDVIDRNEGKAIQKTESLNRTVEVKVDLTGVRVGTHYIQAPQPEQLAS